MQRGFKRYMRPRVYDVGANWKSSNYLYDLSDGVSLTPAPDTMGSVTTVSPMMMSHRSVGIGWLPVEESMVKSVVGVNNGIRFAIPDINMLEMLLPTAHLNKYYFRIWLTYYVAFSVPKLTEQNVVAGYPQTVAMDTFNVDSDGAYISNKET